MSRTRDAGQVTKLVLEALVSHTATEASTGKDVTAYIGVVEVHVAWLHTAGSSPTWAPKLQTCATNSVTDGDWSDITGASASAAADGEASWKVDKNRLKKFVRIKGTIGGSSSPAITQGAWLRGVKRQG